MSGNFIKPPSMGEGGGVQLPMIAEAAGLPPEYVTAEMIRSHIIPCVSETFSDGEVVLLHEPVPDPVLREHFGVRRYDEGSFGKRLRELFDGDDIAMQHQVDGLIRVSATVLAHDVVRGDMTLPSRQTVELHTRPGLTRDELAQVALSGREPSRDMTKPFIAFDHQAVALERPPKVVVDYGPGLQGRLHIDEQLADWQSGQPPYAYLAVGKGPFANEFLQQYWAARLGDDPQLVASVIGNVYIGREDGIAAATSEFAATQQQHFGTPEFADVVIASGVHTAGRDELGVGIANAHKMLQPGGVLLIRAPKEGNLASPSHVSAESMVDMALEAGFDPTKAQFFDTTTGGDAAPVVQSTSAVFRK